MWSFPALRGVRKLLEYHSTGSIRLWGGRGDFVGGQVMRVLRDIETKYPQVGRCLLNTYFPGGLTMEDDINFWEAAAAK
jgi:hypothetical protein